MIMSKVPSYQYSPYQQGPYHRVVIRQQPVIIEESVLIREPRKYNVQESELLKRIRQKKHEWFKKIKEGNKEQRKEAVENLAGFCFDAPVRAVLEKVLLSDAEPEVRKAAAKSLGRVNNWKALAALKKAKAEDPDEAVRKEADQAIKKVKEKFLKKLKAAEELFSREKKD